HRRAVSASPGITAVIFDMDGVLTDSEPLINAAAVAMFREKGHQVQADDFIPFVGTGEDRYLGGVAEKHGIQLDLPEAKRRTYEIYLGLVPEKLRAFPSAVEFVQTCRKAGLRVAVASSADRIKIEANLEKIGLPASEWDAVISGEEVVLKKPAPDIFLAAAQKLGVLPTSCVVIEDAVNGVAAARAAGMRCVAVAQTFPAARLQDAHLVRSTIQDVSLKDFIDEPPQAVASAAPVSSVPPPLESQQPEALGERRLGPAGPWGFWATVGFGVLIALGFLAAQTVVVIVFALTSSHANERGGMIRELEHNGSLVAWATIASTPVAFGLSWLFAWFRRLRSGFPPTVYLGLTPVRWRTIGVWCLAVLGMILVSDVTTVLLGKPIVPEVMIEIYRSTDMLPLLWLAIIVLAPIGEEVIFRGFLLPGLSHTRLGSAGAVALTSAGWASIHFQYDVHGIMLIFVAGLLLGAARLRTGSILPCIAMHALQNFVSTIETVIVTSR
ncbi:MAG TPA: HAD-IA family hydrolase, partial [Verrucomicrobiae bacterium]|nr:HAD-IA family hydrolase [Verrucomicrobiae bacterium]